MTRKQLIIFVVAILSVSISLYSAFKPAPKSAPEKMVQVEDTRMLKSSESFAVKVRRLASQRSLRGLYRISAPESEFFMAKSLKALKDFDKKGLKIEELSHSEKNPTSYTCMVTNAAGQKGSMLLYSSKGKKWSFVAFMMDKQEAED